MNRRGNGCQKGTHPTSAESLAILTDAGSLARARLIQHPPTFLLLAKDFDFQSMSREGFIQTN